MSALVLVAPFRTIQVRLRTCPLDDGKERVRPRRGSAAWVVDSSTSRPAKLAEAAAAIAVWADGAMLLPQQPQRQPGDRDTDDTNAIESDIDVTSTRN
jgi:hypothetical protein